MALNPAQLATALAQVDINLINSKYIESNVIPPGIPQPVLDSINLRATQYAQAIHTWILTATVNTTVNTSSTTVNAPGSVNVAGTAVAQTNPAPIVGTATGTGTGLGTLS
jgi:hypothetical protein